MKKEDRPYSVQKYNKNWIHEYEKEKNILLNIFGDIAIQIEHIGSTSVLGMSAKPEIDILIIVKNLSQVNKLKISLIREGYEYTKLPSEFNERYFSRSKSTGEKTVSVHIRTINNPQSISSVYFRDYLKSFPKEREIYSVAKFRSYNNGKTNRTDYTKNKKEVLLELLEKAKIWHEKNLP